MRFAKDGAGVAMLALLGAGGLSTSLADTPASPEATPSATAPAPPTTTAPAVSPPAAAAAAPNAASTATAASEAAMAAQEKRLRSAGYKPEMQNGQKVWCRREGELGSRLGGQKVCGTPDELKLTVDQSQDAVRQTQKLYNATGR